MRFISFSLLAAICAVMLVLPPASARDKGYEAYNKGDYNKAVAEWVSASSRGDVNAPYNLGVMYENGTSPLSKDLNSAMNWYLRAANRGNLTAMVALARNQIATGQAEAGISWLNLAARWNYNDAIAMLNQLKQPVPVPDLYIAKRQSDDQAAATLGYSLGCALAGGCAANQPGTAIAPTTRNTGLPKWIRRSWHDAGHTMCEYADGTVLNVGSKSCPSYIYGNGY